MSFEQLELFQDPVLDSIVEHFIKNHSNYTGDYCEYLNDALKRIFKIKNNHLNNTKDKLKSILYNKIKADLSQNLFDYLSINKDNVLSRNQLFSYLDKDYRYVINYGNFVSYISEDKLSNHFEDYDTGDIAQAFDVIEDKVVNFKVTRVILERID